MRLPHLFGAATRPFTFVGCLELREILDRRARDERELMEGLEQIPAGSIYYHTHGIFLRHPRIGGGYPNDFANWVATQLGDKGLAERLASTRCMPGSAARWRAATSRAGSAEKLGRENFLITRHLRDYLSLQVHLSR